MKGTDISGEASFEPHTLLPKENWRIKMLNADHIAAGIFEHPPGCRWWKKIALADLPNDLIGIEDLKRFGIPHIDVTPVREFPT